MQRLLLGLLEWRLEQGASCPLVRRDDGVLLDNSITGSLQGRLAELTGGGTEVKFLDWRSLDLVIVLTKIVSRGGCVAIHTQDCVMLSKRRFITIGFYSTAHGGKQTA